MTDMRTVAAGTSILVSLGLVCLPAPGCAQRPDTGAQRPDSSLSADSLKKLSIEQLMNVEVTSVSKRRERLTQVASAIQVITQDDIRRSGVTSLPEAVRLATNLQVAQVGGEAQGLGGTRDAGAPNVVLGDDLDGG